MALELSSPAFADGERIPPRYARSGANISPPLRWSDAPPETRSFALIVEDPDAPRGTFRHWGVYDLSPLQDELPEDADTNHRLIFQETVNDFGSETYDGPQPPPGHGPHHYHFRLAALDVDRLDLDGGVKASEMWSAARPHIIAEAELVGVYEQ